MKEKFIGNFIFLILVNVLIKPLYVFGIDMKVQETVGADQFGLYFILFNFSFLFFIILDLGLTQYNSRVVAQDPDSLKDLASNFIATKFFLGIIFLFSIYISGYSLGYSFTELKWLFLIGIIHFLNSLTEYLRSNIAALHLFKLDAILSIINRVLLIIICGTLLYSSFSNEFKIQHFIYAQIITLSITAICSLFVVIKRISSFSFSINKDLIFKIIKEGYPYALLVLLTTIYTRTDAVMLKELLPEKGNTEAGYYAAAYRFLDMAAMFGLLMASQLLPIFARLIKEKATDNIRNIVQIGFKIIMFISITIAVCLATFGQEIIQFIFEEYPSAYVGLILSLLIFSLIPIASSYVFNTLMNANSNLKVLNIIGVGGVILNIALNFILIPKYQALGAVYATLFTQSLVGIIHIIFANRILALKLPITLFIKTFLFGLLMWGLMKFILPYSNVNWMVQFIIGSILAIPIAGLTRVLDVQMVKDLIKQKNEKQ